MTTPVPVTDYTSRDFVSLRADLLNLIPQYLPEWTSQSDNDFGVVLLDLFAYVGDTLHYYIDRVANEAYLDTASKRSSVLRHASLLSYVPTGNIAAQATITLTNSDTSPYTMPAGTQLSTVSSGDSGAIIFETDSAVVVPAASTANVSAHEGQTTTNEILGVSDGSSGQAFMLLGTPIVDGSVVVTVTQGASSTTWTEIDHLIDASRGDFVFITSTDDVGIVSVQFGDDVNGRIPTVGSTITATYRVGGGSRGNVPAGSITVVSDGSVPGSITCNNQTAAVDGADSESTDDIRRNAPASLQTLKSATSLKDYSLLAVGVPGVALANAVSTVNTSVLTYIAPTGGGGLVSGSPSDRLVALQAKVQAVLQAAAPANVSVTVLAPTYVPVDMTIDINLLPNFSQTAVVAAAEKALQSLLSFDNVVFGDLITETEIHLTLGQIPGVAYVVIQDLSTNGVAASPLSLTEGQVPIYGTVHLNPLGGIVDS